VLPLSDYNPREETKGWKKPRLQSYCKKCQRSQEGDRRRQKADQKAFRQAARKVGTDPTLRKVKATIEMMAAHCGGGPNEVAERWWANFERLEKTGRNNVEAIRQIGLLVEMMKRMPAIDAELAKEEGPGAGAVDVSAVESALAGASDADLDRIAGAMAREIIRRREKDDGLDFNEYVDPADLATDVNDSPGTFDPTADDPAYQAFEREMEQEHRAAAERELAQLLGQGGADQ
jgi:hypothetical protein